MKKWQAVSNSNQCTGKTGVFTQMFGGDWRLSFVAVVEGMGSRLQRGQTWLRHICFFGLYIFWMFVHNKCVLSEMVSSYTTVTMCLTSFV